MYVLSKPEKARSPPYDSLQGCNKTINNYYKIFTDNYKRCLHHYLSQFHPNDNQNFDSNQLPDIWFQDLVDDFFSIGDPIKVNCYIKGLTLSMYKL